MSALPFIPAGEFRKRDGDLYRFLGLPVAIRSNVPAILAELRLMYGPFLARGQAPSFAPSTAWKIDIYKADGPDAQITIDTGRWIYRVVPVRDEAYTERFRRGATEPDKRRFTESVVAVRVAVLEAVADLLRATPVRLFHAAAVVSGKRATIIHADQGMECAVLVIKLLEHGSRLIASETVPLDLQHRSVLAFPSRTVLTEEMRGVLGLASTDARACHPRANANHVWTYDIADLGYRHQDGECEVGSALFVRGWREAPHVMPLSLADAVLDLARDHLGTSDDNGDFTFKLVPLFAGLQCFDVFLGPIDETAEMVMRAAGMGQ